MIWWLPGKVTIPAISVRAPWWWWLLYGEMDVLSRYHPAPEYRGPVLIHASKWWVKREVPIDNGLAREMAGFACSGASDELGDGWTLEALRALGGHVVGQAELVDVVERSESPWFEWKYGLVLRKRQPLREPFAMRGHLGLFDCEVERRRLR